MNKLLLPIALLTIINLYSSDSMSKALKHYENMLILDKEITNREEIDNERNKVNKWQGRITYQAEIEKNNYKRIQDKDWLIKRLFFIGKYDKGSTLYGIHKNIINYIFKWVLPKPKAYIYSIDNFKKHGNRLRDQFKITFYFDLLSDISVTRKLVAVAKEYFFVKEVILSKNEIVIKKSDVNRQKIESQFQSFLNHENNKIAEGCTLKKISNDRTIFFYAD